MADTKHAWTEAWDDSLDPSGMWMAVRPGGVLALWDGASFILQDGAAVDAPRWFIRHLPPDRLLGELVSNGARPMADIIRNGRELDWSRVSYMVTDMPDVVGTLAERLHAICQTLMTMQDAWSAWRRPAFAPARLPMHIVMHLPCGVRSDFERFHTDAGRTGCIGSMLRPSQPRYAGGRFATTYYR